ncbi:MAG TPA: DUF481 domain-containing protein, partial [Sedimentisphaerales bacterium]|nr:DUF481 domain-containing protein [Sedimentisphaerales bacterium]
MADWNRTAARRSRFLAAAALAAVLCCSVAAWADEVVLVNGDKLTGTIDSIVGGRLKLKSPLLGMVEIDMIHVQSVSSDANIPVLLSDGTTVLRRLGPAPAGKVALQDETQKQYVGWDQITAVNPPPAVAPPPAEKPSWTGSVSAGVTSIRGNTRSDSIQASLNMSKRYESARTTLQADYGRASRRNDFTGRDETTENWWRLGGKYDHFFSKRLYGYLEGRYATDRNARLDRRIIIGSGAGYQWIESPGMNFST